MPFHGAPWINHPRLLHQDVARAATGADAPRRKSSLDLAAYRGLASACDLLVVPGSESLRGALLQRLGHAARDDMRCLRSQSTRRAVGLGYVATCEEIAVVTEGETLDEVTANLCEAVALHLDGEDMAALGCSFPSPLSS